MVAKMITAEHYFILQEIFLCSGFQMSILFYKNANFIQCAHIHEDNFAALTTASLLSPRWAATFRPE